MTHTLKSFLSFWQPQPDALQRILLVERALLERRRQSIERRQAMLRVKLASTVSAIEQIEQELQA